MLVPAARTCSRPESEKFQARLAKAEQAGRFAAQTGADIDDCPYATYRLRARWERGWISQKQRV